MNVHRIIFTVIALFVASSLSAEAPVGKWGAIPLTFEPNYGQADPSVRFLARGNGYGLFFTDTEAIVSFARPDPVAVRMKLVGQNEHATIEALETQAGASHYFLGSNSGDWQGSVPHFGRILYRSVYPGIDLVYYGNQRQLEYDFTIAPGANARSIQIDFTGAEKVSLNEQGDLVLQTSAGNIRHQRPIAYQEKNGSVKSVPVEFALLAEGRVGFDVGNYDRDLPLVIDPTVLYSSYFGGSAVGSAGDQGNAIVLDSVGNAYITGFTTSTDFVSGLANGPRGGGLDAFIMRLSSDGTTLLSASYLGGAAADEGHDIALDAAGNIYITGYTSSTNFPIVGGLQTAIGGLQDAFVVKFNNAASTILYSTYLGGALDDRGTGIVVDQTGNVFVTGPAGSRNFPTRNPFQGLMGGGLADAFITKFSPTGALIYSTYIGGVGHDQAYDIAVDDEGNAHIVGFTTSINFPTAKALVDQFSGGADDAFVAKLNPAGNALVFSTYMGGTGSDNGVRVILDPERNIYFTGYTTSTDFPITANAYQPFPAGEFDAFLAKFSSDGQEVPFSTYIGADGSESGVGLALDPAGNIYLAGFTSSFQFYTVNPVQRLLNNGAAVLTRDAYVMKFTPDLATILYSTYLGGAENDGAVGLAVDAGGNAYLVGYSLSDNFPVANAFQPQRNGGQDGFIAKINADDIKTSSPFSISTQGGAVFMTDSGTTDPMFGYAIAEVTPGVPPPTGLAVVGLRQVGQLVSEVAMPLSPLIQNGRMFVELGGTTINTVLTIMNPNDEEVTVTFYFTDSDGEASNFGTETVPAQGHFSRFLTDIPFGILTDTSGTLTFDVTAPVSVVGFRTFSNQAGQFILSRTPIYDPYAVIDRSITIPVIADSLGWNTQIVLVNQTEDTLTGEVRFFGPGNTAEVGPMDITTGDVINGLVTQSVYPYEIPPRTVRRIITASAGETLVSGFATVVPALGTNTPASYAIVSLTEGDATTVQTTVESQEPQSSLRLYAETAGNFAEFEALSIRTAIALTNPTGSPAKVRLELTNLEGAPSGISAEVTIPAGTQLARFLDEIPGLANIPNPFSGVMRVTVLEGQGVTAVGMRTRAKEFGGFLATTTSPIPDNPGAGSTVIFPHIAEGGGYTTEFILLSAPGGQASSGVLHFVSSEGQPLNLSVR